MDSDGKSESKVHYSNECSKSDDVNESDTNVELYTIKLKSKSYMDFRKKK